MSDVPLYHTTTDTMEIANLDNQVPHNGLPRHFMLRSFRKSVTLSGGTPLFPYRRV